MSTAQDDDQETLRTLIDHMISAHVSRLSPGEIREFLPSVKHGDGVLALLDQHFENVASVNETAHRLEPVYDSLAAMDVYYYLELLNEAAQRTGLSPQELERIYRREKHRSTGPHK